MSENEPQESGKALEQPIGRFAGWCLRAPPWPFLLLALAIAFGYFWLYRSPVVAMVGSAYEGDFCLGSLLFFLVAIGRALQIVFVRNSYVERLGVQPAAYRSRRWFWPWFLLIVAGTYYMVSSQWPMRVCFQLSRPWLDNLADEAVANPANAPLLAGRWAGVYRIAGVEIIGKTVVLYLDKNGGTYGFARVPGAASDYIHNTTENQGNGGPVNHYYHRDFPESNRAFTLRDPVGKRMTGDWFVMYSGYLRMKGWS